MRRSVMAVCMVVGLAGMAAAQIAPQTFDLGNLQKHAPFIQTTDGKYRPLMSTDMATDTGIAAVEAAISKALSDLSSSETGVYVQDIRVDLTKSITDQASSETGVFVNNIATALTAALETHATKVLTDAAAADTGVNVNNLTAALETHATKVLTDLATADSGVNVNNLASSLETHATKLLSDLANGDSGVALSEQACTETVIKVTCTLADTEYSIALPATTLHYEMRGLTSDVQFKIAYVSGESGTNYWPLFEGDCQYDWGDSRKAGARTIYVQSPTAGAVLVIHCKLQP